MRTYITITITIALTLTLSLVQLTAQAQETPDSTAITIGKHRYISHNSEENNALSALKSSYHKMQSQLTSNTQSHDSLLNLMVRHNDNPQRVESISKNIQNTKAKIAIYKKNLDSIETDLQQYKYLIAEIEHDDKPTDWRVDVDWSDFYFRRDKNKFHGHWAGIELGINGYLNPEHSISLNGDKSFMELDYVKSWYFAVNIIELNLPIHRPNIGIVTGMGFGFSNYCFANDFELLSNNKLSRYGEVHNELLHNRLSTGYVNFPLILEFQFPSNSRTQAHIGIGITGSIRMYSEQIMTWREDGINYTKSKSGEMNLNSFRYGATIRVGYGYFKLFANYSLVSLFKTDQGPELYPFNVGIVILNI